MRPTKSLRTRHPRDRFACPATNVGIGPRHGALLPAAAVAVALAACTKAEPDAPRAAPVAQMITAPVTPPAVAPSAPTAQAEAAPEATGDPFAGVDPSKSDVLRNIARLEAAPAKAPPRQPAANRTAPIEPPSAAAAEALSAPVAVREAQGPTLAPPVAAPSVEAPVATTTVAATPTTAPVTPAAVASVTPSALATGPRRALAQPRPEFPREALREGISEGRVVANLAIAADGRVTDVAVLSATPSRAFGRAAQQALRDWRYEAATAPSSVQVELVFRIE